MAASAEPAAGLDNEPENQATGRRALALMFALVVAELLSSFEGSMIYGALAQFYRTFHDPVGVGWLVTGFMLVASISAVVCGRLGDMFGRRRVLLVVMAIAAFGSALSSVAESLTLIVIGRSVQGVAGAILPLCYGLVREHFPSRRIAFNIGIVSATASAGSLIGIILGGVIVDHANWRLIFVVSFAVAVVAIAVAAWIIPTRSGRRGSIDWLGAVLFCAGMGLLLYALGLGEKGNWGSSQQLAFAVAGALFLAAWVWWELRIPAPMIDVRLLANKQISLTLITFFLCSMSALNLAQVVLVMMQQPVSTGVGLGLSATLSGVLHAPSSLMGILASPLVGWLAGRRGARSGMIVATAVFSVAWGGLLLDHQSVVVVTGWMTLNGFGMGALMAAAPNLIVETAPADRTSETTGLAQIVRKVGMACGAQCVAVSLASGTVQAEGGVFPDGGAYQFTYGWIAAVNLLALVLSLMLPRSMAGKTSAQGGLATSR